MRNLLICAAAALLCACSTSSGDLWKSTSGSTPGAGTVRRRGELQLAIHRPRPDLILSSRETSIEVEGGASVFGGVKYLDLMLVLDTSQSLIRTDRSDYRSTGAIGLVEGLSPTSDIQIGVVEFDSYAKLVLPLTADRSSVVETLRGLDRQGQTDLALGIRTALTELERAARPDGTRVILLFTDGKSSEEKAYRAMLEARERGVVIHTLLLGQDEKGTTILRGIAEGTGGSFIAITDPARIPWAFMSLRTTGIERVTLQVNDGTPIPARLLGGTFGASLPLVPGANRIIARARSLEGDVRETQLSVFAASELTLEISSPLDGEHRTQEDDTVVIEGEVNAFAGLPSPAAEARARLGTESVLLRLNDEPPISARVENGRFRGRLRLREGENRVVALARSIDGRRADDTIGLIYRPPGCAELQVTAVSDGLPALSISNRAVEIVFDASNSMWGQMDGEPKIGVARDILHEALDSIPDDMTLALRVYGHRKPRELRDCTDSELLVGVNSSSHDRIRAAIAGVSPRGQTPLAYSLNQIAGDLADFEGERAVVLVTDGIESCGGDPVAAARALRELHIPVHVIGFGISSTADEDSASLAAIATASGGRFLSAATASELRAALAVAVGTPFRVLRGDEIVGVGALGDSGSLRLPEGRYLVRIDSVPPRGLPVTLTAERQARLVLERNGSSVAYSVKDVPIDYARCARALPASPMTAARLR